MIELQPHEVEELKLCVPKSHQSALDVDLLVVMVEQMLNKVYKKGFNDGYDDSERGYGTNWEERI